MARRTPASTAAIRFDIVDGLEATSAVSAAVAALGGRVRTLSTVRPLDLTRREADLALRLGVPAGEESVASVDIELRAFASEQYAARVAGKTGPAELAWIGWAPPLDDLSPNSALGRLIPGWRPSFASDDYLVQIRACELGLGAMMLAREHRHITAHKIAHRAVGPCDCSQNLAGREPQVAVAQRHGPILHRPKTLHRMGKLYLLLLAKPLYLTAHIQRNHRPSALLGQLSDQSVTPRQAALLIFQARAAAGLDITHLLPGQDQRHLRFRPAVEVRRRLGGLLFNCHHLGS